MSDDLIKKSDAIKALDNAWINGTSLLDANEAVKQLNDLPSADTFEITKEALIEAIYNAETVGDIVENIIDRPTVNADMRADFLKRQYEAALEEIERLRADRPQGEWTYCSERMPAEAGAYLCLTEIPTVIAYRRIKIGVYHDINGWMLDDVIAWMPLPKLWEGADDES